MKLVLLEKTYYGFENSYDFVRDTEEAMQAEIINKEFTGEIKVTIEYIPSDLDLKYIRKVSHAVD